MLYTQDEVKHMIHVCLSGIKALNMLGSSYYIDEEDDSFRQAIGDVQDMFSQILCILNVEYNEIWKTVEAYEQDGEERPVKIDPFH